MRGPVRSHNAEGAAAGSTSEVVHLRLYLSNDAPASLEALKNVRAALEGVPAARYTLKVIDAYAVPEHAIADGVLMTPALVCAGEPSTVLVGVFSDPARVLDLLQGGAGEREPSPKVPAQVAGRALELARQVTTAMHELQALVGNDVDMVLDPADCAPVILPASQRAARDEAHNFRRIFEEAPLGMALLSHDFRFLRTNYRLSSLTGFPPCELLKMGLSDLSGEEGGAAEELKLTGSRKCESGFCEGETRFRKKNGEEVWLRLSLALVQHPQKGRSYFLLIVQDVTEMKRAEAELHRYHSQLEELVRERTAEVAETNRKLVKEIEERLEAEDAVRALNEELEARVRERTAELEQSNTQLETMNRFFVGRELRMAELKREISTLEEEVRKLKQEAK